MGFEARRRFLYGALFVVVDRSIGSSIYRLVVFLSSGIYREERRYTLHK